MVDKSFLRVIYSKKNTYITSFCLERMISEIWDMTIGTLRESKNWIRDMAPNYER